MKKPRNWSLFGIPDDEGIRVVGGRPGAREGPRAFREALKKMSGLEWVRDALKVDLDLEGNHDNIALQLRAQLEARGQGKFESISLVVGGGHDHAFSHLSGLKHFWPKLGCINLDAHLDVRKPSPDISSGSGFYLAIEKKILEPTRFVEFGIQNHCNSNVLFEYVSQKKIKTVPLQNIEFGHSYKVFKSTLDQLSKKCDAIVISLDLDCMAEAFAPGVSAPQAIGFTTSEIEKMLTIAGKNKKVMSLGVFELSPPLDREMQTSRVAAKMAMSFLQEALKRS